MKKKKKKRQRSDDKHAGKVNGSYWQRVQTDSEDKTFRGFCPRQ